MKTWRSIVSLLLVLVFALELLPLSSFAVESNDLTATKAVETAQPVEQSASDAVSTDEPYVVSEVEELREEAVKHFRMSDGSFLAVQYDTPVHYKDENNQWQEIDNTLIEKNGKLITKYGDVEKTFSQTLSDGKLFDVKVGDYSLGMSLMSPGGKAGDVVMATEDSEQAELDAAAQNAEQEEAETADTADEQSAEAPDSVEASMSAEAEVKATPAPSAPPNVKLPEEDSVMRVVAAPSVKATTESKAPMCVTATEHLSADALVSRELSTAEVCYSNALQSVDLKYQSTTNSVKESIIIKAPQPSYSYSFLLTLKGVTPILQDDGSITCSSKEGTPIFVIPAPYMIDAAGAVSLDAKYGLKKADGDWVLTVTADAEWMNASDRAFPVTLDPTASFITNQYFDQLPATYVVEGTPTTTHVSPSLLPVGYGGASQKEMQVFFALSYSYISVKPQDIISAKLSLTQSFYSSTGQAAINITAHQVTGSPGSAAYSDWIRAMTWNNKPSFSSEILDHARVTTGTTSITLDVTRAVKSWFSDSSATRALALTAYNMPNSGTAASYLVGYSSPGPVLYVVYRNDTGLEPCYSYQSYDVGYAGTAYISDHNTHLTVVTPLISFASTSNPFSLELIYNNESQTILTTPTLGLKSKLGQDMKLNIMQKVETSGSELKYTDDDGTEHYFSNNGSGNVYYDEEGLGLKIQVADAWHSYMTNDDGNKWTFMNGYLAIIEDGNGNQYEIHYIRGDGDSSWHPCGTNDKLQSVVQKNKDGSAITVATFLYDNDDYITSIDDYAGRRISFQYSSGFFFKRITSIARNDETLATFGYISYMTHITDGATDRGLALTYDGSHVTSLHFFGSDSGNNRETTTVSHEGDHTTYTTGQVSTTYLFDYEGRTVNAYTTQNDYLVGAANAVYSGTGDTNRTNNRTMQTGEIGVAAHSWMRNGNFENTSAFAWTFTGAQKTNTNIAVKGDKTHTGSHALKGWVRPGASGTATATHQTYDLRSDLVYCASAYVDTSEVSAFGSGGCVCLEVLDASGTVLESDSINYKTSTASDNGWVRLSVSFQLATAGPAQIRISTVDAQGIFYADDVQVEPAIPPATIAAASNVNLIDNSNLQYYGSGWSLSGVSYFSGIGRDAQTTGAYSLCASGNPTLIRKAFQTVPVNLPGTETYILSGWAQARSVYTGETTLNGVTTDPASDGHKRFGLCAELVYSDGNREYHYAPFNADLTEWQFTSVTIVPKQSTKTVASIKVSCLYNYNANTNAYFDDISLVREVAQTMKYDSDGYLESVTSTGAKADQNSFTNGKLIQTITAANRSLSYSYEDDNNSHLITKIADGAVQDSFSYDDCGNIIQENYSTTSGSVPIRQKYEYTGDGNLLESTTAFGDYYDADFPHSILTFYTYESNYNKMMALPSSVSQYHTTTSNSYDQIYDRLTQTTHSNAGTLSYSYTNGNLDSLTRTNYTGGNSQTYSLTYNAFGDRTSISVGSRTLANFEYDTSNGNLMKQIYANGAYTEFTYDPLHRHSSQKFVSNGNTREVHYAYNGNGYLAEVRDGSYETTRYTYDSLDRPASIRKTNPNGTLNSTFQYDDCSRIKKFEFQVPGAFSGYESFYYKTASDSSGAAGSLTSMSMFSYNWISYTYDSLHRLNNRVIGETLRESFNYATSQDGQDSLSTTQIQAKAVRDPNNNAQLYRWEYAYDRAGNILRETDGNTNQTTTYSYDIQNQLTHVSAPGKTYSYTYDNAGNIQTASIGNATHTYTYGDSQWKDLLTAYDGHTISYDAIGNPTSYYNGSNYAFTWAEGRRLATATKGTATTSYTYDADGMRTRKTNADGSRSDYYWADGRLLAEWRLNASGSSLYKITYLYDENHSPVGLVVGTGTYYFAKNMQGDVIAIYKRVNTNGTLSSQLVAKYEYDPWGKVTVKTASGAVDTSTTSIGNLNPFRFKGYYYDTETGFYYLQSRYYDPAIGRFINADVLASTGQGYIGYNMFAYCENNPVAHSDQSGMRPQWLNKAQKWLSNTTHAIKNKLLTRLSGWAKTQRRKGNSSFSACVGVSFSAGFAGGGSLSRGIAFDGAGNIGIIGSYAAGSSFASVSVNRFITITNASSMYALGGSFGDTLIIGASGGDVYGGGADVLLIKDPEKTTGISGGLTLQGGVTIKAPVPFEVHTFESGGFVRGFNCYDIIISFCDYALKDDGRTD